jgi:mono/diheme cytochrome c family protein
MVRRPPVADDRERNMSRLFLIIFAGCILSMPLAAQSASSTKAGVYSREQSIRGQDIYAGNCKSCHVAETHTGPVFTTKWNGRALSELYVYIRDQMPKNEPGSLSTQEYADVLAYMLRLNRMPAGPVELPPDSAALRSIRIETTTPVRKDP